MTGFETVSPADEGSITADGGTQQAANDLTALLSGDPAAEQGQQPAAAKEPVQAPIDIMGQAPATDAPLEHPAQTSEQGQEETFTIKVNGEDRQVTLNELKSGFQLQSDYTRGKQALATEQQQLGLRSQEVSQQRDQYGQLLGTMKQRLNTLIPPEPDWARLAAEDPINHTRQRAAWDQLQQQVKDVEAEQQRVHVEQQTDFGTRMQAYMAEQQHAMLDRRPELADREKAQKFFTSIGNYAMNEYGFQAQEISNISDHRVFLIAEKAMLWDQSQAAAGSKVIPAAHIPAMKPGPRQKTSTATEANLRKARNRLARSGSTADAAAAIEAML